MRQRSVAGICQPGSHAFSDKPSSRTRWLQLPRTQIPEIWLPQTADCRASLPRRRSRLVARCCPPAWQKANTKQPLSAAQPNCKLSLSFWAWTLSQSRGLTFLQPLVSLSFLTTPVRIFWATYCRREPPCAPREKPAVPNSVAFGTAEQDPVTFCTSLSARQGLQLHSCCQAMPTC